MHINHHFTGITVVALAVMGAFPAYAEVLLDRSPAAAGVPVTGGGLDNRSTTQNFAEDFRLDTAASVTGMAIYMDADLATLGQSVTVRWYAEAPGVPGTKLADFTSTVSDLDTITATNTASLTIELDRVFAAFDTPLALDADTTYWIGMSGTGNADTFSLAGLDDFDDSTMAQFTDTTFGFISGSASGDMAFQLEGMFVPEPGAAALLLPWVVLARRPGTRDPRRRRL
ncbi:MAG: hypothetical protein GVY24_01540 [Planctomycetes bacterium]|jgi:hypothetical protein|nr:hypothetical protein [Planctomycetota bacterium]